MTRVALTSASYSRLKGSSKSGARSHASARQKFFTKHGADFGLKGNWNLGSTADASRTIHQHINNPAVRAIEGTYRGNSVTHFVDPKTGLNIVADSAGNFVSGWRLGAEQLQSVLTTGRLF
jgi:pyocin large subunit-like protein